MRGIMKTALAAILLLGLSLPAVADPTEERAEKERCLTFSVWRDTSVESSGAHLKVTVSNRCSKDFSGTDTWFEVSAISQKNGGTAGKEVGRFQSTIPADGKAETWIDVACNPEERYNFNVKLWP
jgi:hypothetical protein